MVLYNRSEGDEKITYGKDVIQMTKKEKKLQLAESLKKALATDGKRPQKGVDSGALGKTSEGLVRYYCNDYRAESVCKELGKIDMRKKVNGKMCNFEIKQGGVELAELDRNGAIVKSVSDKNDYMIYCTRYDSNIAVEKQYYVIPMDVFMNGLIEYDLMRYKATTPMQNIKKAGGDWYYDRIAVQNNSLKKQNAMWDMLEQYGISLEQFAKQAGWTVNPTR